MTSPLHERQKLYAEMLIKIGVNLQPGQSLMITADLAHAGLVRLVNETAYRAGAKYVHVAWADSPTSRGRMLNSRPEYLDYVPDFEIARHRQAVDETWARLALAGDEFPDVFDEVDPSLMRRVQVARAQQLKFYSEATMSNHLQWCVAAAPTAAWSKKVFPQLEGETAVDALWEQIFKLVRADQPDPIAAWQHHDVQLRKVTKFMARNQVCAIRYFDPALVGGKPATDLTIGLTGAPVWVAASSVTPAGVRFLANMPTEEVFTSPHRMKAEGYVRTSKPSFPLMREVRDAYVRFEGGEVVEFHAAKGEDVLQQFFEIPGARRLGEASLVDVRSPVNQSGLLFYETLFDENAVCHIAFGKAYTEGMAGAGAMSEEQRIAMGLNHADTHVDMMIGTPTMHVYGTRADGSQVTVMETGQFAPAVFE